MSKKIILILKTVCFFAVFFLFSYVLAFFLKDDTNSYARVLRHEFHNQEKIDYLISGASHVSHGVNPLVADKKLNKSVFNLGTPAQQIDGTCALLKQAVQMYRIEKVFLEMDFNIATSFTVEERPGFTASYIVMDYLKDPKIKLDYMLKVTKPEHYLNTLLPIGKDKLMDLNPKKIIKKIKAVADGQYFKYEYKDDKSVYAGKGCVLDSDAFEEGSISAQSKEPPIVMEKISDLWKSSVAEMIRVCKERNIEIVLFSMPVTDFYLNVKQNYNEYFEFIEKLARENGIEYYDFNLCKPDLLDLKDWDFSDDNHLNASGIEKFTNSFCDVFSGKIGRNDGFYSSYSEKMAMQKDRIFGLQLITAENHKSMEIIPVTNHVRPEEITYDFYAVTEGKPVVLGEKVFSPVVVFPGSGFGQLKIISYVNGVKSNEVTTNYFSY